MDQSDNFSEKIAVFLFREKIFFLASALVIFSSIFLIICFNKEIYSDRKKEDAKKENAGMEIIFLDVGQGDSSLFTFQNGEQMLVDCGKDSAVLQALGRVMPFYDNSIDYLLITHPDIDHYGGCIDVMKRFEIKNVVYNGLNKQKDEFWKYFMALIEELKKKGVNYTEVNAQMVLPAGGSQIQFIYPDHSIKENPLVPGIVKKNDNNTSLVFSVNYGGKKILMAGDMEVDLEKYLLYKYSNLLKSDILKVGHHGSDSSTNKDFLNTVHPQYAVISVGKENKFGHPSRRTLKKLDRAGAQILRTDEKGDILFTMTGSTISTEK